MIKHMFGVRLTVEVRFSHYKCFSIFTRQRGSIVHSDIEMIKHWHIIKLFYQHMHKCHVLMFTAELSYF